MNIPLVRRAARLAWIAGGATLSACVATTPEWDSHFGEATRATLARQVLHPQAARNADPVAGMDGASARAALQGYEKSFNAPAPQGGVSAIGVSDGK